jgi:predicted dehydrogenase
MTQTPKPKNSDHLTRRDFLAGTGAAALSLATLSPASILGADPDKKITFGLIGCGGRGQWIGKLFLKHGGYQCAAVADYFPDRAGQAGKDLGVPSDRQFSGLAGYKKLLELNLDAVVIISPPYFHPEQAAAAVDAGKHVYLAKPIAVDVPGCQSIAESGRKAAASKLCFTVDFQTRAIPDYQEAVKRVHGGMIGKIALAEATYHCGNTFDGPNEMLKKDPKNPELLMRAWGLDKVLSGDIITEQNIHALDVASWVLNAEPVKAVGTCGHVRGFAGTCHDHFAVIFYYPDNVICSFNSKQFGHGYDDILCRVFGTNGTLDTHYGGKISIRSSDDGFNGTSPNIYEAGAVTNIASFHKAILAGDYSNPTVANSVRSNLTTILGRTAAYKGGETTWADMMKKAEKLQFDMTGLKV